ncbi:MAG: hypothetical protein QW115_02530 [Thermoplasmata archaeon]
MAEEFLSEEEKRRANAKKEMYAAEKKYQGLIEKRDALNAEAERVKAERDALNQKKKEIMQQIETLRKEKREVAEKLAIHKKRRDELNAKAKELVAMKREKKDRIRPSLGEEVKKLEEEIAALDRKQQTTQLTLEEEREIIAQIKAKTMELTRLRELLAEQERLIGDVKSLDETIKALFEEANKEHVVVVNLSTQVKEYNEKIKSLVDEVSHVIAEANKKHEEFMELKNRATECHLKAKEMREKIITTRRELRMEEKEAERVIEEHNEQVKRLLMDEKVYDEFAEKSVEELLKKGRINMGPA